MVTITTDIATAYNAAFKPLYVIAETDRFELTKATAAVSAYARVGGTGAVKITIATGTSIATGDTVEVADATGARSIYNGRYNIDSIPTAGILHTDIEWPGTGAAGGFGLMTRKNYNLTLRMDVYDVTGATALIASKYAYPSLHDGDMCFIWDVSRVIQNFTKNFTTTTGYTALSGHLKNYIADITEVYQDAEYASKEQDDEDVFSGDEFLAVRSADITDRIFIATGSKLLHGYTEATILKGSKLPVSFLTDDLVNTHSIIIDGATALSDVVAGNMMLGMIATDSLSGRVPVYVHIATAGIVSETLYVTIDEKCYPNAKTFYFLNKYGGYDWYDFLDITEEQESEKMDYEYKPTMITDPQKASYIKRTFKKYRCIGRPAPRRTAEYIGGLIYSPEVYDEDGVQVRVTNQSTQTYGEEIIPEITIEFNNERCINFQ
jgi:hypothetical protein